MSENKANEIETPQDAQKIILLVTDPDDPKQGEIMVIDEPRKAESTIAAVRESAA